MLAQAFTHCGPTGVGGGSKLDTLVATGVGLVWIARGIEFFKQGGVANHRLRGLLYLSGYDKVIIWLVYKRMHPTALMRGVRQSNLEAHLATHIFTLDYGVLRNRLLDFFSLT